MNVSKQVFRFCLLIAVIGLLLAYGLEWYGWGALTALGLGLLGWIGGNSKKWSWVMHLFLTGAILLVMLGVLIALSFYFLLPVILSALAAWDLARFQFRIGDALRTDAILEIEKRHLNLLGLALGAGGILAGIVLSIQVQISFGIALISGVILIIILGQIYRLVNTG